ncbi:hypothetical protein VP01_375g1 [Puccinia sorghi]|uniref:Uncharacterized protein n=1 Tax=Puccinia sorghi TaxID=27349 RepID=A0A0L6UTR9_9BASI|nr:hypothetical protein VP01_375g1 [Puccinia sorghi]
MFFILHHPTFSSFLLIIHFLFLNHIFTILYLDYIVSLVTKCPPSHCPSKILRVLYPPIISTYFLDWFEEGSKVALIWFFLMCLVVGEYFPPLPNPSMIWEDDSSRVNYLYIFMTTTSSQKGRGSIFKPNHRSYINFNHIRALHNVIVTYNYNKYLNIRYNSIIYFHFFHLSSQGFFYPELYTGILMMKSTKLFLNIYTGLYRNSFRQTSLILIQVNHCLLFKPLGFIANLGKPLWCRQCAHGQVLWLCKCIRGPLNWHYATVSFKLDRIFDKVFQIQTGYYFMIGINYFNPLIYKIVLTWVCLIYALRAEIYPAPVDKLAGTCNSSKSELIYVRAATSYPGVISTCLLTAWKNLLGHSVLPTNECLMKLWNLPVGATNTTELLEFLPSILNILKMMICFSLLEFLYKDHSISVYNLLLSFM